MRPIPRPAIHAAAAVAPWPVALPSIRRLAGAAIATGGAVLLAAQVAGAAAAALEASAELRQGVGAALLAGLATGLGALPLLFFRRFGPRLQGALFSIAGGLMAGAAVFGLLLPAIAAAREAGPSGLPGVAAGLAAGVVLIALLDRLLPHLHALPDDARRSLRQSCGLMVVAIGLHNLPEGMAVGASFQGGAGLGLATALGIGIQNLPEGLIVGLALVGAGVARPLALAAATLTGLFEPLGALVGGAVAGGSAAALPLAMAIAAGAMLFVVVHDVLPNAARTLAARHVAAAFVAGGAAMVLVAV